VQQIHLWKASSLWQSWYVEQTLYKQWHIILSHIACKNSNGCPQKPVNEECGSSIIVSSLPYEMASNNELATSPPNANLSSCYLVNSEPSTLWWEVTVDDDTCLTTEVDGPLDVTTMLAIFQGDSCSDLACVTQSSDTPTIVRWRAHANQKYFAVVARYSWSIGGNLTLRIKVRSGPITYGKAMLLVFLYLCILTLLSARNRNVLATINVHPLQPSPHFPFRIPHLLPMLRPFKLLGIFQPTAALRWSTISESIGTSIPATESVFESMPWAHISCIWPCWMASAVHHYIADWNGSIALMAFIFEQRKANRTGFW
jgi:hypothetical protein